MHLEGEKFFWNNIPKGEKVPEEKKQEPNISRKVYDLGYWRKHPDLHGYIINEFTDGRDDRRRIRLSDKDIKQIILAIKNDELPKTEGFFFGESSNNNEQKEKAIKILTEAIEWLSDGEKHVSRDIYYNASW